MAKNYRETEYIGITPIQAYPCKEKVMCKAVRATDKDLRDFATKAITELDDDTFWKVWCIFGFLDLEYLSNIKMPGQLQSVKKSILEQMKWESRNGGKENGTDN